MDGTCMHGKWCLRKPQIAGEAEEREKAIEAGMRLIWGPAVDNVGVPEDLFQGRTGAPQVVQT